MIDTSDEGAKGFVMEEVSSQNLFQDKDQWRKLQLQGIGQDLSWKSSAELYLNLYQEAISRNNKK